MAVNPSGPHVSLIRFQKLRKKGGLVVTDVVEVFYEAKTEADAAVLKVRDAFGGH